MAEERQRVDYNREGGGGGSSSTAARQRRGGGRNVNAGEGSSSAVVAASRRRSSSVAVWPEHFVESVAVRVAVDAAMSEGRLAAGPAIAHFFQVCSTWRNISQSEMLWQDLTNQVWSRHYTHLPTWHAEFIHLHRTARNFRTRRSAHSRLLAPTCPARSCCCLSVSDSHVAAGFLDGNVRVFTVPGGEPVATFSCHPSRDRLGRFSRCVSGLAFLTNPARIVFAYRDGDVHVAVLNGPTGAQHRAHSGDVVVDGPLLDFAGNNRWWIGLFAGAPGRSWHIWDAGTEQLIYVGGSLTDAGALMGWYMLTDFGGPVVGRVRLAGSGTAVGCSSSRIQVMDLNNPGFIVNELALQQGEVAVDSVNATTEGRIVYVDMNGVAKVCHVPSLDEICSFDALRREVQVQRHAEEAARVVTCVNWGYVICFSNWAGAWDALTGEFLYRFRERIGNVVAAAASDRYVVAWSSDSGLHLWDFGAM